MNIETTVLRLNSLVELAYKNPFQAMDELASTCPPKEVLHLRDAVLLHIASLCMSGLNPVAAKALELRAAHRTAKIRITRTVEYHVLMLFAQGVSQKDIARVMALSIGTVNSLISGRYPFAASEEVKLRESLGGEMEDKLKVELDKRFAKKLNSPIKKKKNQELLAQVSGQTQ
jgi:DNA-binding CsgD family transcriptional regulator